MQHRHRRVTLYERRTARTSRLLRNHEWATGEKRSSSIRKRGPNFRSTLRQGAGEVPVSGA